MAPKKLPAYLAAFTGGPGSSGRRSVRRVFGVCVMGRAILALSGHAAAWPVSFFRAIFGGFWMELTRDAVRPYRPELHYMRGPGPAWRKKHGLPQV